MPLDVATLGERRKRAAKAAYWSGALLLLTGGSGAVATVQFAWQTVAAVSPRLADVLKPLFIAAWIIAVLGGLSVILGGYVLKHHHRLLGKTVIALGAGIGLIPFALYVLFLVFGGGHPLRFLSSMALTAQGIALLLAIYAQAVG